MSALATRTKPSEAEVLGWMESLKSWGRWGTDDMRGTLNHIEPRHVLAASRLVRTGKTISCAIPITYNREPHGATGNHGKGSAWKVAPQQFIIQGGEASKPDDHQMKHGGDVFLIAPHGSTMTHLDAPCHLLYKGLMYNGLPSTRLGAHGAEDGSIELAKDGSEHHTPVERPSRAGP